MLMKKYRIAHSRSRLYSSLILGLLTASSARAADDWESWITFENDPKPWSVSVGTRIWANEWETNTRRSTRDIRAKSSTSNADPKDIVISTTQGNFNHNRQVSADHEAAVIPFTSARYGRFFVGGSYYTDTTFSFANDIQHITQTTTFLDTNAHPVKSTPETFRTLFSSDGSRSEWDISVGYYLLRGLAFTVGYKEVNMKVNTRVSTTSNGSSTITDPNYSIQDSNKFSGPTLGLSFSLPISYGISGYGSYTHGFMNWDYRSVSSPETITANSNANYDVAEIGFSYSPNVDFLTAHVPVNSASIFAGYRYQRLQYDISLNSSTGKSSSLVKDATDTTQGFVSGINIGF